MKRAPELKCVYTGEIVASIPIPMVSTKKPNRKIAILVIRPPKGRGDDRNVGMGLLSAWSGFQYRRR